jgi:hypothetical protein
MRILDRACLAITTTILFLVVFAAGVSAQNPATTPAPTPENPFMTSQRFDRDKETLYAIFSENKRGPSPEQQQRAYGAAREFVRRYGGIDDTYAKEARKFVTEFEKGATQYALFTAYGTKNYAKAFELGRPLLKKQPEDFFVLGVLAEAGYENALAGNASLNEETIDYLRRAITLVEAGKVSKADPFKTVDVASGFLNLALGWFLKDKSPVEAAAAFVKAVQPKSPYQNDPLTYYRLGVAILKGEFTQLSTEYNEKYGTKGPSPEQQAMFERIKHAGERAIDAYARAVALSDPKRLAADSIQPQFTPEFRGKVQEQLTALYKSLHNNSDGGLNELIAGVLSKPMP